MTGDKSSGTDSTDKRSPAPADTQKDSNKSQAPDKPTPRVVQTVVKKPPTKGKATIEQIKALQAQRAEREKALKEANEKAAEEQRRRREEAEILKKKQEEELRLKREEQEKVEKLKKSIGRFNLGGRGKVKQNVQGASVAPADAAQPLENPAEYKSPICCVLGHVDTGKTKILDKLRESNVQEGEAGGITQQIGATFFPTDMLSKKCGLSSLDFPGVLVIDTPGHESFSNLRSRGSSICDLAILVIDIVHGLEQQTLESISLLRSKRTPFIVALNKIDRLYDWKPVEEKTQDIKDVIEGQADHVKTEFNMLVRGVIGELAGQGLNAMLSYENDKPGKYVSLVPTSAVTGEGIADLIKLILKLSVYYMKERMKIQEETECTVLEVKPTEGHGVTLDAILSNGELHEGDRIGVCGLDGPIITTIKALLLPQPLKEMRVKAQFQQVKSVRASVGVKIAAVGLEGALAGSRLYVVKKEDGDRGDARVIEALEEDITGMASTLTTTEDVGISAAASTLGSMEALLAFLKSENVPVGAIILGKVRKRDVVMASVRPDKEHRVILGFNVAADREMVESAGVTLFEAEIIYHLIDKYKRYVTEMREANKKEYSNEAIFPCELRILPDCVFTTRSPLVLGVEVVRGTLRTGTPLCVFTQETCKIGTCVSIMDNKKNIDVAGPGKKVPIKIESTVPRAIGRHLEITDPLYSVISRRSIDLLKEHFRDDITQEHIDLIVMLKRKLEII